MDENYLVGFSESYTPRGPGIPLYPDPRYRLSAVIIDTEDYCDKTPPPCTYGSTGAAIDNISGRSRIRSHGQKFNFGGAANLDTDEACDKWYITHTRELVLLHDDIHWDGRNMTGHDICLVPP